MDGTMQRSSEVLEKWRATIAFTAPGIVSPMYRSRVFNPCPLCPIRKDTTTQPSYALPYLWSRPRIPEQIREVVHRQDVWRKIGEE